MAIEREMEGRSGRMGNSSKEARKMCHQGRYVLFSRIIKYTKPKTKTPKASYNGIITAPYASNNTVVRIPPRWGLLNSIKQS